MKLSYFNKTNNFFTAIINSKLIWFLIILLCSFITSFAQTIEIDNPVSVAEGEVGTATINFTVSISQADPINPITIDYRVDGGNEDGTETTLTFAAATTSLIQIISITTNGDAIVEADEEISITLSNPSSNATLAGNGVGESSFLNDDIGNVTLRTIDAEASEDGLDTGEYMVDLGAVNGTANPIQVSFVLGGITQAVEGVDFIALPSSIQIPVNERAAIITLTPIDDALIENNEVVRLNISETSAPVLFPKAVNGVGIDRDDIAIISDDVAGFTIIESEGSTLTSEAGITDTFTVVLDSEPTSNVVLTVISSNEEEGTVLPATLTFTPADFNIAQTVTITGVDDNVVDDAQAYTIAVNVDNALSDNAFANLAEETVNAINVDDDIAGFTIVGGPLNTNEAGDTDTFTVVLDSEPISDVILAIVSSDVGEGIVSSLAPPFQLIFTPTNFDTPQAVTITGQDDAIVDGNQDYTITVSVDAASAAAFSDLPGQTITATNTDNDVVGVTIDTLTGITTEAGGSTDFIFTLTSEPTANVFIPINLYDTTETSGPASIIITPANWNTGVTLTVTGVDDTIIDGDIVDEINTGNPSSIDPLYDALIAVDVAQITVTNQDDDTCAAGSDAPILDASIETVFCDSFNQDLDDYNSSIIPSGSVLRWSTSNTDLEDETNHLASSIVNIPDTYFGFFFDTITGCFSDVLEVTLTVNTTPSAGTATNIAACSIAANGISVIDLDDQLTGADAGAWSFVNGPAGGSTTINGANEVNFVGQPDGNYTYRYTTNTAIAPCTNEFEDLIITVTECVLPCNAGNISPELNTSLPVDFCDTINVDLNDYVVNTTAPAGTTLTWSTNSDPLIETAHIGSVIFAPGVYYGFFFDAVNGCASPTLDILFTINLTPTISSTTGGVRCGEGTVTLNATSDQVGVSLNWYNVPVGGAILETNTSFTTPIIAATTSFYVEVTSNGCVSERTEVIATVNDQPSAGIPNNTTACDSSDAGISIIDLDTTLSNQDLGIWIFASGPAGISPSIDSDNNVDFNGLPLGDYIFTYTTNIAVSPCTNESIEVTITVIECDNDTDLDGLLDNEEDIIGTDPDNPDTDGDGVQDGQEVNTDNTDPLDDCDSVGGTPLDTSDCDNDGLTTEEENELGTNPNQADTDGDGLTDGEEVLIVDDPSTTAIPESDTDPLDPCDPFLTPDCNPMPIDLLIEKTVDNASPLLGANITFTISVTNLTIDRVIDVTVTDILVNGFVYVSDTASSGIYNQETGAWTIAEIAAEEVVNLEITVTVVSLGLLENTAVLLSSFPLDDAIDNNTATVEINAIESPCTTPGTLCNIFSPNGDGVNDRLIFVDPAGEYNQNRLEIFDRYGNAIFEMQGYDSSWDGTYNNKEVPNGTYFYILDLNGDGTRVTKGWIQIIR